MPLDPDEGVAAIILSVIIMSCIHRGSVYLHAWPSPSIASLVHFRRPYAILSTLGMTRPLSSTC